jgi:hypothetical protein
MPRHLIQGPDGAKHIIEAPEGATPEQIIEFAQTQFGGNKPAPEVPQAPDTRTEAEKRADERVKKERSENRGVLQTVDDTIRNLARGTPVGSFMDEIAARGNALIGGEPYETGVEYQRATDRAIDAESTKVGELPVIGDVTVGGLTKLTGAIASAPVAPIARFFGGGSLLARTGNAAASGAGYGALYGSGEGDTAQERTGNAMAGAGIGFVGGGLIPGIAAGARNVTNAMANAGRALPEGVQNFAKGAVNRLARGAEADDLTPQNYLRQARDLGPEGMLADMGPNLGGQATGIATQPGAGQKTIIGALDARRKGAASRTEASTDRALGPARNLVQLEKDILAQAREQATPHYELFYETPIPMTQEIATVWKRVPKRVVSKAQELAELDKDYARFAPRTGEPNGIVFDLVKRAADDLARDAKPGTNEARLFGELARDLRNAVDNALSPGQPAASPWAVARSIAGDGMQFREGLKEGRKAFLRGTHPDQMEVDLAGMSAVKRAGYNEGARGQIRDTMGNAGTAQGENSATAARKALGSDYARQKIAMVAGREGTPTTRGPFGKPVSGQKSADELIRRLEAETKFANTDFNTSKGTQTAARQAAQKEFPNAADTSAATEVGKKSFSGVAMEGAYRVANALVGGALNSARVRVAADAARMLVAQGAERDAIVRGLRQYAADRQLTGNQAQAVEQVVRRLLEASRQRAVDASLAGQ